MAARAPSIPEGLDLLEGLQGGTVISRRWLNWMVLPMALFAAVWDSFLVFWYTQAAKPGHVPWIAIVFPLGHVAVGVWITYSCLATIFNRTEITLGPDGIRVWSGPIPWRSNQLIATDQITDLIIRSSSGEGITYGLYYVDPTRKERRLVKGLPRWEQAEFIELTAREILGLPKEEE